MEDVSNNPISLEKLLEEKLGNTELRDRIIRGCRDESKNVARYFLFWVAESIGLGSEQMGDAEIVFEGYEEKSNDKWEIDAATNPIE